MKKFKEKITWKSVSLIALILFVVIGAITTYSIKTQPKDLSYIKFNQMLADEKIDKVDLVKDADEFIAYSKDIKYKVSNPKTETFKESLLEKGVEVESNKSTSKSLTEFSTGLFQILFYSFIIFAVFTLLNVTAKKRDNIVKELDSVTFKDIAGNNEAKKDMEFLVSFLENPDKYKKMGAKLPKGVVLYGPPGTGKTLMAKAVAGEAGVPFLYANGSDFIEMYAGLGAKRVRDLFNEAKENAPCIVFIDEVDAVGSKRGVGNRSTENDQTINALLAELDGFGSDDDVIVMVATNRLEDLDSALIRPGRFDRHVSIDLPDSKDRKLILERYSKGKKLSPDVDFESLSKITIGFSGATLEALMNEAAIIAVNKGSEFIKNEHIEESYSKIAMKGSFKENRNKDEKEVKIIAYHEAGHALVTKLLTDNHLHKVTIIPSTSGMGGATFTVPNKLSLLSKKDIHSEIKVLYAGRAAEEILAGNKEDVTSGASMDIQQATGLIDSYFSELGMSEKFGMLAIDKKEIYMEEAVELSKQLYSETLFILNENKEILSEIANKLIEKETISGKEVEEIIQNKKEPV